MLARARSSADPGADAEWAYSYDQLLARIAASREEALAFWPLRRNGAMQSKALRGEMLRLMLHARH
jgi:hypothetical protein